ncbi:MAG: hypothetical protein JOZ80_14660 [Acidobacteriaceae bacterium]|nr:hypothetical protein [Acidobacteriaceae bacterium]
MTIRRMKTYTGEQGYVYQYYFVGKRAGNDLEAGQNTEYIFDVTADRKTMFAVSVFLPTAVVDSWTRTHSRALTDAEQYGAVKMRLFKAFDEIENMLTDGRRLSVDSGILEHVLGQLGVA